MKLVWHIDRAKFEVGDADELQSWVKNPTINFEFSPAESDDGGESVFTNPDDISDYFRVSEGNGSKFSFEVDGNVVTITAWIVVDVEVVENFDADVLDEWSSEQGGWASCSIDMGEDVDTYITEDDGGDWRIHS